MPTPNYLKAWLFLFLIATVGGAVAGFIVGGVLGLVLGIAGFDLGVIKIAGGVAGFLIGMPISFFTFRWVVSEFIVKPLLKAAQPAPGVPPPVLLPPVIPS